MFPQGEDITYTFEPNGRIRPMETFQLLSAGLWSYRVPIWAETCVSVCMGGEASLRVQAYADLVYTGLVSEDRA